MLDMETFELTKKAALQGMGRDVLHNLMKVCDAS